MRLTALPPPPPQPTTLIRARPSCNSLSFTTSSWCKCALAMASSSWFRVCSLEKIAQPPHCFLVRVGKRHRLAGSVTPDRGARSPLHKSGRDRERWSLRLVGQTDEPGRLAEAGGGVEDMLGGVHRAHQARPAAGDDHARGEQLVEACLANLFARHLEDLGHARTDDLGEEAAGQRGDPVTTDLPYLDLLRVVDHLGQGVA